MTPTEGRYAARAELAATVAERELSYAEIARKMSVTRQAVGQWVRGVRTVTPAQAARVARILRVPRDAVWRLVE